MTKQFKVVLLMFGIALSTVFAMVRIVSAEPSEASVRKFNGTYTVTFSGTRSNGQSGSGSFTITVANGVVSATVTDASPPPLIFSGTVSASGAVMFSAIDACGNDVTFTGEVTLKGGASMSGSYSEPYGPFGLDGRGDCTGESGTWTATRIRSGGE